MNDRTAGAARERLLSRLSMCPGAYDPDRDAALLNAYAHELAERQRVLLNALDADQEGHPYYGDLESLIDLIDPEAQR